MKNIKYLLLIIFGIGLLGSCSEEENILDQVQDGSNIVVFEQYRANLVGLADGSDYNREFYVKVTGPALDGLSGDVSITVAPASTSTAKDGIHYRINNPTLTLSASNNYLGVIDIVLVTAGNAPPEEGTPEFDAYVAPVLDLEIKSVSGATNVVATGKSAAITLNYTPFNPYEGDYDAHLIYRHPSLGTYPNNVYVDEVNSKTFKAITGTKCETWFATWDTNLCWIKVNSDNSITFVVDSSWPYDVQLGDPFDPSKVSRFDPQTRKIYLYYHYYGAGGARVFWEVFTPKF